MDIEVITANYRASNAASFLAYLDALSQKRRDGGMIHGGHIHYIQGKAGDFVLKAAIQGILNNVPDVWPLDLPEIIEKNPDYQLTEKQLAEWRALNQDLLVPIYGEDLVEIIRLAREYAAEEGQDG